MNEELSIMTVAEAAKFLNRTRQTIYNWIAAEKLHPSDEITIKLGSKYLLVEELKKVKNERQHE